ncbi:UEV-domain-containing protein [Annulohypoxylon maeteangense]|uniref:UEV-domain-containing protein n=1 Tax=Annulohypoxylon maeteangense TaxID=1927788 RepID=UPI002008BD28|nr:UEV-domain-containing protein [Annulohypoxylon maeteangense]KAI0880710.1 UEV-domain-containing protein [Annulohypoxylon maeteangense]
MVVQQHVLNWLYSVLTSEYQDVNRTYNDVAQALSQYPSLSPRTDVHTFDNGVSALLLHLSGTIPVIFRGTTYRFPISLWIPHAYPREAPLGYVTPAENMMVRPGQHVDPQGRIYHPYLVGWAEFWDKSSLLDFIAILRDIFAKEPPVVSRQQAHIAPIHQSAPTPTPPPVPPLPPDISRQPLQQISSSHINDSRPPPPPPKDSDLPQVISGPSTVMDGPPRPPLPDEFRRQSSQYSTPAGASPTPQLNRMSRYDAAPPLPPQQAPPQPTQSYQQPPPNLQYQPQPQQQQQHAYLHVDPSTGLAPQDSRRVSIISPVTPIPYNPAAPPGSSSYGGPPPNWQHPVQQQPPAQPKPKPLPPPDLMDEPFSLALPSSSATNLSPPPIPPNPEKDALLRQLASTLHSLRQRARSHNESSLLGLAAQRNAMLAALQNLQSDSASLTPLTSMLASNTSILQNSLQEADRVISSAQTREPPPIDDLLVAPTVAANQLYDVVAEERALGDAIFVLGRAVERGRISPAVFAKTTRSLAREWFLKKALARKIGRGMGLAG